MRQQQHRIVVAESGRERLLRSLQFAELCIQARVPFLAMPIFREIARTLRDRGMETWERQDVIMRAWSGLRESSEPFRSMSPDLAAIYEEADQELKRLLPESPAPEPFEPS